LRENYTINSSRPIYYKTPPPELIRKGKQKKNNFVLETVGYSKPSTITPRVDKQPERIPIHIK